MKRKIAWFYRLLLVILGLYGLYLNFRYGSIYEMLHYFTILSNIIVILFFIFLLIKNNNDKCYSQLKGSITMAITVTFLIFHFLLRPMLFNMIDTIYSPYSPANLIVHYVVPIMTIFDWLLFDKKGHYKRYDPFIWLSIPFVYFIIMTINGICGYTFRTGSHYPYYFMDWEQLGFKVLWYVMGIVLIFTLLGYIYYGIDCFLALIKKQIDNKNKN